jgi:hypothetical protein
VYNQHKRGIIAHKDKEQDSSTPICGLSLGAARVLSMSRSGIIIMPASPSKSVRRSLSFLSLNRTETAFR